MHKQFLQLTAEAETTVHYLHNLPVRLQARQVFIEADFQELSRILRETAKVFESLNRTLDTLEGELRGNFLKKTLAEYQSQRSIKSMSVSLNIAKDHLVLLIGSVLIILGQFSSIILTP